MKRINSLETLFGNVRRLLCVCAGNLCKRQIIFPPSQVLGSLSVVYIKDWSWLYIPDSECSLITLCHVRDWRRMWLTGKQTWSLSLLLMWHILTLDLSLWITVFGENTPFFFFAVVCMFGVSVFLRAIQKKIIHVSQWFWRMLIMTLPCYYFKRSLLPVTCPPPCLLALASPTQPQQPFPPSEQSHAGSCSSLYKMKKRCKRSSGVRTNAQRLGLPKAHRLPTERSSLPQQQSGSVPPPPSPPLPCWRLPALKCSISCLWAPSPPKQESQNCWQDEEKEKGIY